MLGTLLHSYVRIHWFAGFSNFYWIPRGRLFCSVHWTVRCARAKEITLNTGNLTLHSLLCQYHAYIAAFRLRSWEAPHL